ncbi:MAG: hypothetical protein K6G18_08140 [Treponema sp.]|nr:hypothetical protein [Treponema sp.]
MPRTWTRTAIPFCLILLLVLASCSPQMDGDPLLDAWADACVNGGRPDAAHLAQFHDQALDYASSPVFNLKTQDIPEIEETVREIIAFSASDIGNNPAEAEAIADRLEALLLHYSKISSLSSEHSSYVIILILLLLSFFSLLLVVSMILFLRQQRHINELRRKAELEKAVNVATIKMQENERSRIYKELHDTIAQDSRSALFALQNLRRHINDSPDAKSLYEKIEHLEGANIENVRTVIRNIIPPDLLGDFRTVLTEWVANVSHAPSESGGSGVECKISIRKDVDFAPLSQEQRLHLFRIMQEAVSNASRHSGADEISVLFRGGTMPDGSRSLVLIVSDDGRGFDATGLLSAPADPQAAATAMEAGSASAPDNGDGNAATPGGDLGHYGMHGMKSRAEILGGTFRIQTEPGEGCEIYVEVPLEMGGGGGN